LVPHFSQELFSAFEHAITGFGIESLIVQSETEKFAKSELEGGINGRKPLDVVADSHKG
jgi:hypothetical protein